MQCTFIKVKRYYNSEEVCEGNRVVFAKGKEQKARIQTALLSFTDFKTARQKWTSAIIEESAGKSNSSNVFITF